MKSKDNYFTVYGEASAQLSNRESATFTKNNYICIIGFYVKRECIDAECTVSPRLRH